MNVMKKMKRLRAKGSRIPGIMLFMKGYADGKLKKGEEVELQNAPYVMHLKHNYFEYRARAAMAFEELLQPRKTIICEKTCENERYKQQNVYTTQQLENLTAENIETGNTKRLVAKLTAEQKERNVRICVNETTVSELEEKIKQAEAYEQTCLERQKACMEAKVYLYMRGICRGAKEWKAQHIRFD